MENKYEPNDVELTIDQDDIGTLCICALRYCMGRRTYMPDLVRCIVRSLLGKLSDKDVSVMLDDCAYQKRCDLFGDPDIDKPGWVAWETELRDEKERRKESASE